ncbi:hypothetical protein [Priestia megaterium]|uniref:hypothetical protein n=1 Tax=Priestia megaterium TaxID=1404 RepID=UPI00064C7AB6|nr:hypothetical protein [Priestia megaterium]KLV28770.1 hypothetical protein ABW04_27965 [Priestia megaterium]MBT2255759.1 hypothetical protein [Priestia megaterium]
MSKIARTYRLSPEGIEKFELIVAIHNELQQVRFKTRLSQADVFEQMVEEHYQRLTMDVGPKFLEEVKKKMNK